MKTEITDVKVEKQAVVSTRFSESDYHILDRHYKKYTFLGITFRLWDTSPRMVLDHLKEVKRLEKFAKIVSDEVPKAVEKLQEYRKKSPCICNEIMKNQGSGYCHSCKTSWL